MSYHCSNSVCANHTAQLPQAAAEKLDFQCFLCETGKLVIPQMTLDVMLKEVDSLPIALQIMPRLNTLLNDDHSTMHDIINVTRTDAALVTQIIKISNSAIYAMTDSRFCSTLEEALNRIGFNTAYKVVGYVAAKQIFQKDLKLYCMTGLELWEMSVRTAICMQNMADRIEVSSDSYVNPNNSTAYTVGLLYPIGKMLINHYHETIAIPALSGAKYPLTEELEKKLLGFNHRDAAKRLLAHWGFQDEVILPIFFQSKPLKSEGDRPVACLLAMIAGAVEQFPVSLDIRQEAMAEKYQTNSEYAAIVGISKNDFLQEIANSASECLQLAHKLAQ